MSPPHGQKKYLWKAKKHYYDVSQFIRWKKRSGNRSNWIILFTTWELSCLDAKLLSDALQHSKNVCVILDTTGKCSARYWTFRNYHSFWHHSWIDPFALSYNSQAKVKVLVKHYQTYYKNINCRYFKFVVMNKKLSTVLSSSFEARVFKLLLHQFSLWVYTRPKHILLPKEFCTAYHHVAFGLPCLGMSQSQFQCQCGKFRPTYCNPVVKTTIKQLAYFKFNFNTLTNSNVHCSQRTHRRSTQRPLQTRLWHPNHYIYDESHSLYRRFNIAYDSPNSYYVAVKQYVENTYWKVLLDDILKLICVELLNSYSANLNLKTSHDMRIEDIITWLHDYLWSFPAISVSEIHVLRHYYSDGCYTEYISKDFAIVQIKVYNHLRICIVLS